MKEIFATSFADRLCHSIKLKRTPLIVGLDPRWEQLPESFHAKPVSDTSIAQTKAESYRKFCCEILDVIANLVPAVKPQAAFFEQLGPEGMAALGSVVDYAKSKGLLVIMDAKRGDIGSTAEAYATAYLGEKPQIAWGCDALTVNPYLGGDSLQPFVAITQTTNSGIFVLVKTSNPGSRQLQDLNVDGEAVFLKVADQVQNLSESNIGENGFGAVGAVAGATYPEQLAELRQRMPNALLLIPGFGAQGGTAKDTAAGFREDGLGAIINSSRGIIFASSLPRYARHSDWLSAVEQATRDSIQEIATETNAKKLNS